MSVSSSTRAVFEPRSCQFRAQEDILSSPNRANFEPEPCIFRAMFVLISSTFVLCPFELLNILPGNTRRQASKVSEQPHVKTVWWSKTYLYKLLIYKRGEDGEGIILFTNRPFAAEGHMIQNPKYWRAKECVRLPYKTQLTRKVWVFCVCISQWSLVAFFCSPIFWILHHVTSSCKWPLIVKESVVNIFFSLFQQHIVDFCPPQQHFN